MNAAAKKRQDQPWLGIVEGIVFAAVASIAGILLLALAVKLFGLSDGVIPPANQILKIASILIGVFCAVRRGARGLTGGAIVGAAYIALGAGIYMLADGGFAPVEVLLAELGIGTATGVVSGILIANLLKK